VQICRLHRSDLLFKQGIGQLEVLMFIGAGIEEHQRAGTETFDLTDVMRLWLRLRTVRSMRGGAPS
jgi:hypothetical protein